MKKRNCYFLRFVFTFVGGLDLLLAPNCSAAGFVGGLDLLLAPNCSAAGFVGGLDLLLAPIGFAGGAAEGLGGGAFTIGAAEGFGAKRFCNVLLRLWMTAGVWDFARLAAPALSSRVSDCVRLGGGGFSAGVAFLGVAFGFCSLVGERVRGLGGVLLGVVPAFGGSARVLGRPRGFVGSSGLSSPPITGA